MKKWRFGGKALIDEEKVKAKAQAKKDLRTCIEMNDEAGYLAIAKGLNADLTPEDMVRLSECFREQASDFRKHHL
jgi:hypothetical protein